MSWIAASFGVLALALALGFAWYERSRPSAGTLALVATLAALAVVGRIAFAPFPNVKPTTDIILLAGYVLGGAPGFVVGAVTALASNLFFGQGPWTPWQMGAWGLCGLLGAGLAVLSRRKLGRVPLALCCGAAGLAFGAIMDFSTWVTFTGQHTFSQYLAISGVSLTFNLAHAVGNVVFCLAFGPALVRSLERFRARLEIEWTPLPATQPLAVALIALVCLGGVAMAAPSAGASARSDAVGFLTKAQNEDGGFGGEIGEESSPLYSAWAAMGLGAAGEECDAGLVRILVRDAKRVRELGDIERTILGLRACRTSDQGLSAKLARRQERDGSFDGLVNTTSFAIFSLRASGRSTKDKRVRRAAGWLAREQNKDGGFNFGGRGGPSGIDDTAAALQGLRSAGRSKRSAPVRRAASFLTRRQNGDGGFPLSPGSGSNSQSTAWAVQGLLAAGRTISKVRRKGSRDPLAYLESLTAPDGAVRYSRTSSQTPVWVTAQALTALSRKPFPIIGRKVTRSRAASARLTAAQLTAIWRAARAF